MSPQSMVCATCGATVPYGRLSCPACGELLASVAGAARSVNGRSKKGRAAVAERPTPAVLTDVPPQAAATAPSEPERAAPGWEPPIFQSVSSTTAAGPVADTESDARRRRQRPTRIWIPAPVPPRRPRWPGPPTWCYRTPGRPPTRCSRVPRLRSPAAPVPIPASPSAPGAYVPPVRPRGAIGPAGPGAGVGGPGRGSDGRVQGRRNREPRRATFSTPRASPNSSAGSPSPVRRWPPSGSCSPGASASSAPRASAISTAGVSPARSTRSSC